MGRYLATITAAENGETSAKTSGSETIAITVGDVVNLPAAKGGYNLLLRRSARDRTKLELVNARNTAVSYWTAPAERVFKLTIRGLEKTVDTLSVDSRNGPVAIEGGVVLAGKGAKAVDTLVIRGTAAADTVEMAADRVTVNGTPYLLQGLKSVTVDTGAGNDTIAVSGLGVNVTLIDRSGTDVLNFSQAGKAVNLNLASTKAQRVLAGNSHTLVLRGIFENVLGTDYADFIRGNRAANQIWGGGGDDTLYGGGADDVLFGGDGNDWLYGGAGNDRLYGEAGNNVLLGGGGSDVLDVVTGDRSSTGGRNLLIGGQGADTLLGGQGEEILIGGSTSYDNKAAALAAVMQTWTSDKGFKERSALLDKGFTSATAGLIRLKAKTRSAPGGTVLDDSAADSLFGRPGSDWLFGFGKDEADRASDDR
jgi:Ca2+-binding RTX toxin-like protein